jgi:hypothetical protein
VGPPYYFNPNYAGLGWGMGLGDRYYGEGPMIRGE